MLSFDAVKDFIRYTEDYPSRGEPGFDGVHDGGIKGLKPGAPDSAVKAYKKYQKMMRKAEREGVKL